MIHISHSQNIFVSQLTPSDQLSNVVPQRAAHSLTALLSAHWRNGKKEEGRSAKCKMWDVESGAWCECYTCGCAAACAKLVWVCFM